MAAQAYSIQQRASQQEARVLVVDDEPEILEEVSLAYSHEGYLVFKATNYGEAKHLLETEQPDVLVLDIRMPGVPGTALLSHEDIRERKVPVVMVITGYNDLPPHSAYEQGVDAIFPKPFRTDVLLSATQHFLRQRTLQFEARRFLRERGQMLEEHERLQALGRISSYLAHEIQTPLTVIQLRTDQLVDVLARDATSNFAYKCAVTISGAARALMRIVRSIRTLTGSGSEGFENQVMLLPLCQEIATLYEGRMSADGVGFVLNAEAEDITADCNRTLIGQAVANLISNALDAVESVPDRRVELSIARRGSCVQIAVTDSGPGIPAQVRERLFQPYSTTKPLDKGSGLGLAITRQILDRHGGRVYLDESSAETRMVLELPSSPPSPGTH